MPGFGETLPLPGEVLIRTLADALTDFLRANALTGVDAVGSSMGARLVLELARRGSVLGAAVSLDPGGFWDDWERHFFYGSVRPRCLMSTSDLLGEHQHVAVTVRNAKFPHAVESSIQVFDGNAFFL